MSVFWSAWIIVLALLTLYISVYSFVWGLRVPIPTQPDGTTGHDWDGIREAVRDLPRWWIAISVVVLLVGMGYLVLYPGLGAFNGVLDWSSQETEQRESAANQAKLSAAMQSWGSMSVEQLAEKVDAVEMGHILYQDNCAACHGLKATGNTTLGAPNLSDADWQYGGSGDAILTSILDGRNGVMPPWGAALGQEGLNAVASYVVSLGGVKAPADWVAAGKQHFETLCVACHGPTGLGLPAVGAPNVADRIWMHGGDFANIVTSIRDGRSGVMPAWRSRLSNDQARLIAAWLVAQGPRERTAN